MSERLKLSTHTSFIFLIEYTTQLFIATAGAILGGLAIAAVPALAIPFLSGTLDQGISDRWLKIGDAPYFMLPIVLAFVFGFWNQRYFRSPAAYFLAVVPGLILVATFMTLYNLPTYSKLGRWENAWEALFQKSCGETDCYYQYVVTAPFYTTVAYTIGWMIRKTKRGYGSQHANPPNTDSLPDY